MPILALQVYVRLTLIRVSLGIFFDDGWLLTVGSSFELTAGCVPCLCCVSDGEEANSENERREKMFATVH